MFRPAFRALSASPIPRVLPRAHVARRFVSTAPPHQKSRSWKSSAARWGLAAALVYYYNTATAFAEEPAYATHAPPETSRETETHQTVASVSEQRRAQSRSQPLPSTAQKDAQTTTATVPDGEAVAPGSPGELEEEASQEGAFNEETGEINWDCPCLGGMAYGPCGEQFRAAFSCFVFSKEEPKGVDCIEHFKTMQNCFREHPDVYGGELEDDEEATEAVEGQVEPGTSQPAPAPQAASVDVTTTSELAPSPPRDQNAEPFTEENRAQSQSTAQ